VRAARDWAEQMDRSPVPLSSLEKGYVLAHGPSPTPGPLLAPTRDRARDLSGPARPVAGRTAPRVGAPHNRVIAALFALRGGKGGRHLQANSGDGRQHRARAMTLGRTRLPETAAAATAGAGLVPAMGRRHVVRGGPDDR
jgi:hypothetical protein